MNANVEINKGLTIQKKNSLWFLSACKLVHELLPVKQQACLHQGGLGLHMLLHACGNMVINQPVEIKKCLSVQQETFSLWLLSAELPMCHECSSLQTCGFQGIDAITVIFFEYKRFTSCGDRVLMKLNSLIKYYFQRSDIG